MIQKTIIDIDRSFLDQIDLASLIEQKSGTRFGKASGNGTKRTVKGACPWCGGTDRFAVFIGAMPQRYYCGIHGNGCMRHGDAIQFLRDHENLSFREAYGLLTGEDVPQIRSRPQDTTGEDWWSDSWQRGAAQFSADAESRLGSDEQVGRDVRAYLYQRGFTDKVIKAAHLGAVMFKGANIAREEARPAPCLVVPWWDERNKRYWRVEMRDIRPGIDPKRRYESRKNSSVNDGIYGSQSFTRPVFLVEGALDALSIVQEAGDLVAVVATGSTGGSHNPKWAMKLAAASSVFVSFDAEEKGEESATYWLNAIPNAKRWRPPAGKDANDMLRHGISIRAWVEAAIETLATPDEDISEPWCCAECGVNLYDEDQDAYFAEDGTSYCSQHGPQGIPAQGLVETLPVHTPEQFISYANQLATSLTESTRQQWTVIPLEPGYTLEKHVEKLARERQKQEREAERAAWARIRAIKAREAIPSWLVINSDEWNKQVERNGLRDMMQRRDAYFQQRSNKALACR